MSVKKETACRAATLLLAALLLQLAGALLAPHLELRVMSLWLVAAFYLLTAFSAWSLRCWLGTAGAILGVAVTCLLPAYDWPSGMVNVLISLSYLVMYLPVQHAMDQVLSENDVSRATLTIGRGWSVSLVISRVASITAFLPYFEQQAEISAAQGQFTLLFRIQLLLEIAALVVGIVSYVFMVRYLWRARALLRD